MEDVLIWNNKCSGHCHTKMRRLGDEGRGKLIGYTLGNGKAAEAAKSDAKFMVIFNEIMLKINLLCVK